MLNSICNARTGCDWTPQHDRILEAPSATLPYLVPWKGEPIIVVHGTSVSDFLLSPSSPYYEKGTTRDAVLGYMKSICGPDFVSAAMIPCRLDAFEYTRAEVNTTFEVDFPAMLPWPFKMSKVDIFASQKAQNTRSCRRGHSERNGNAQLPRDSAYSDEKASAGRARRNSGRSIREAGKDPCCGRRGGPDLREEAFIGRATGGFQTQVRWSQANTSIRN